jgi:hypothetical protein
MFKTTVLDYTCKTKKSRQDRVIPVLKRTHMSKQSLPHSFIIILLETNSHSQSINYILHTKKSTKIWGSNEYIT